MLNTEILAAARDLGPWLTDVRRGLHAIPELGRAELKTQAFIEARLGELGIQPTRYGTGLVAHVQGGSPGPCVAFRADIDALPLSEENGLAFRSTHPGVMHACGHDAHTAIALGLARFFSERPKEFAGTVKLIFQPDEEGEGGADLLVKAGALESPRAERVFGLHVQPYLDVGRIEIKKGALNGCSTDLSITVRGKGGHGAYPERGIDAILLASHVVLALNDLVSRYVSPLDSAVLTVGTINGGQRSNIIADEVTMKATLRATDDGLRDYLITRARAIVEGIPASLGGSGELAVRYGYAALVNHDAEVDLVASVAADLLGPGAVEWKEKPSMGVEDFSFYIKDRPGAFYHLGCGSGPAQARAMLHSPDFILDEACLPLGLALQAAIGLSYLSPPSLAGTAGQT